MSDVNPVVGVMDDAIDFVRKANDRTYAAEVRVKELEAQCAAMRGTLDHLALWAEGKDPELAARLRALYGDAGRALLERVEALERVAEEVRASIVRPESALGEAMAALDALETKR